MRTWLSWPLLAASVRFDAAAVRRELASEPFEAFFSTSQSAPTSRLVVLAVDQLNIQPGSSARVIRMSPPFSRGWISTRRDSSSRRQPSSAWLPGRAGSSSRRRSFWGATFAALGRDRDAAAAWQLAIGTEPRPPITYTLFADARFGDRQPQSVVDVLMPAWQRMPGDDDTARRLAIALVFTGKFTEALPVFEGYLTRHPTDQDALVSAIVAQYESTTRAGGSLSTSERTRLERWSRACAGPQRAVVDRYLDALR